MIEFFLPILLIVLRGVGFICIFYGIVGYITPIFSRLKRESGARPLKEDVQVYLLCILLGLILIGISILFEITFI